MAKRKENDAGLVEGLGMDKTCIEEQDAAAETGIPEEE
jgi:hypothetical protein